MNDKLFFAEPRHEFQTRLPPGRLAASRRGFALCVADPVGSAHHGRVPSASGRAACEDIEGLQPRTLSGLPLQVTRIMWIIETSFSLFGNSPVTIFSPQKLIARGY